MGTEVLRAYVRHMTTVTTDLTDTAITGLIHYYCLLPYTERNLMTLVCSKIVIREAARRGI